MVWLVVIAQSLGLLVLLLTRQLVLYGSELHGVAVALLSYPVGVGALYPLLPQHPQSSGEQLVIAQQK